MSRFMSQVVLCGANREYNVALIVPDFTIMRSHLSLSDDNSDDISEEDIINLPDFKLIIDNETSKSCQRTNLKNMNNQNNGLSLCHLLLLIIF